MNITVKELMAMEDQFVDLIDKLYHKVVEFTKSKESRVRATFDIVMPDASKVPFEFYITHSALAGIFKGGNELAATAYINIPYVGPHVISVTHDDVKAGFQPMEVKVKCAKTLMNLLALGMATNWLNQTGDLKRAREYLCNDEIQELRDLFDGMIDVHYNATGCSIALLGANGAPMATEAKFGDVSSYRYDKDDYLRFIIDKLSNYVIYGWAFSGRYTTWRAPLIATNN